MRKERATRIDFVEREGSLDLFNEIRYRSVGLVNRPLSSNELSESANDCSIERFLFFFFFFSSLESTSSGALHTPCACVSRVERNIGLESRRTLGSKYNRTLTVINNFCHSHGLTKGETNVRPNTIRNSFHDWFFFLREIHPGFTVVLKRGDTEIIVEIERIVIKNFNVV